MIPQIFSAAITAIKAVNIVGSVAAKIFSSDKIHNEKYPRERDARSDAIAQENSALALRREEIQLTQMKLSYMQHQDNKAFQSEQAALSYERQKELEALSHERQKELEEFRAKVQLAIADKNIQFERWRHQEEKALQAQLATYNRETQLLIARYQRETAIALPEVNKLFETWPLRIVPLQILNSHQTDPRPPIRVIIAPPDIDFDKFGAGNQGVPKLEKRLAEGLRQFFSRYYPLNDATRPIELLDGAWDSKRFYGGSSMKALFEKLQSESVLVLESEIAGDYLNFRFGYWVAGQKNYSYTSVISNFKYWDIVYESTKARARKWKTAQDLLLKQGKNPKAINEFDTYNLEILEEEEILAQAGVDISQLPPRYKIKNEDFEALSQFLLTNHCLVAGLMADVHYLFYYDVPPILPQYLPEYIQEGATEEIIQSIVDCYQKILQAIEIERSAWVPDVALDLANSFSHLLEKTWAEGLVVYSLRTWLKVRNLPEVTGFEALVKAVVAALIVTDTEYVQKLLKCLVVLGKNSCVENLRDGWEEVKRRETEQPKTEQPKTEEQSQPEQSATQSQQSYRQLEQKKHPTQEEEKRKRRLRNVSLVKGLSGHAAYSREIYGIAISPDGQTLVTEGNDNSVKIWDLENGILQHSLSYDLSNLRQTTVKEDLRQTLTGHSDTIRALAISPNGQTLVSGSNDNTIKIWSMGSGKLRRTLSGHSQNVNAVAISPDGQTLVSGSNDNTIKIWSMGSGKLRRTLTGHSKYVYAVTISPDGQTLVSGSYDTTIKIWDMGSGKLRCTLSEHSNHVCAVAISPDGQTIVSGSCDKTIKIWDMRSGKLRRTLKGHSHFIYAVTISPDGQILISGSHDNTIKIWDMGSGELRHTLMGHSGYVNAVAISSDGQTIVSGGCDKTIKIWDMGSGELQRTLTEHSDFVYAVAISPDGEILVSGSDDTTIKIWDLKSGQLWRTLTEHASCVWAVAISPDCTTLVSAGADYNVFIWRVV